MENGGFHPTGKPVGFSPYIVTTIGEDAFKNVKQVTYHGSAEDTAGNNWGALSRN